MENHHLNRLMIINHRTKWTMLHNKLFINRGFFSSLLKLVSRQVENRISPNPGLSHEIQATARAARFGHALKGSQAAAGRRWPLQRDKTWDLNHDTSDIFITHRIHVCCIW